MKLSSISNWVIAVKLYIQLHCCPGQSLVMQPNTILASYLTRQVSCTKPRKCPAHSEWDHMAVTSTILFVSDLLRKTKLFAIKTDIASEYSQQTQNLTNLKQVTWQLGSAGIWTRDLPISSPTSYKGHKYFLYLRIRIVLTSCVYYKYIYICVDTNNWLWL